MLPNTRNTPCSDFNTSICMIEKYADTLPLSCLACCIFLSSCGTSSPVTLPDAPPPWQEVTPNGEAISNSVPPPSPFGGTNPRLDNSFTPEPFWKRQPSFSPPPPVRATPSSKPNYTIKAYANVWVLIQDKRGNEIEWLSMKEGDEVPVMHSGPLTITCSSGRSVKILDKKGKKVDTADNSNGITILRLP